MTQAHLIPANQPILVVGVERSGTSAVAEAVHRWGAYAGEAEDLGRPNDANPRGYWEYKPLVEFNYALLDAVNWPHNTHYKDDLQKLAAEPEYRARAQTLVQNIARTGHIWLWKDPELCILLPFWQVFLPNAVYLVPVRNPLEIAKSQFKLRHIPPELEGKVSLTVFTLLSWHTYMTSLLERIDGIGSVLFIDHQALMQHPRAQCERICNFLDDQFGINQGRVERIENMAGCIDASLWRCKNELSLNDTDVVSDEQRALYAFLLRKTNDSGEKFIPENYPIYPGWREYVGNLRFLTGFFRQLTFAQQTR
jgi:hypothetical protein